jgi:ribonuclease Z
MNNFLHDSAVCLKVIGCGDAFSSSCGSSSYLFWDKELPEDGVLFDCGYQTPAKLFGKNGLHQQISTIVISHFHADHFFGLPVLLSYWILRERRKKPVKIIGPEGIREKVHSITEEAYQGVWDKKNFDISFQTIENNITCEGLTFYFAKTKHSIESYALLVRTPDTCFAISGDGAATDESLKLYQDASFLIHEAYGLEGTNESHEYLVPLLEKLKGLKSLKHLLITHMKEDEKMSVQSYLAKLNDTLPFTICLLTTDDLFE